MERRDFLKGLALLASSPFVSLSWTHAAWGSTPERMVDHLPAIPILMFHKVVDSPQYPEDISSKQLQLLLQHVWGLGYRPVNMSDIILGRVDQVVPKGCMPIGITADDAHPSIVFSQHTAKLPTLKNQRSFVEILGDSVQPLGYGARATFFLSGVADTRYSKEASGYFGNVLPLRQVADALSAMPGIELGYHTRTHTRMGGMEEGQVRALLEDQMKDFKRLGMLDRVVRILAYPFGVKPTDNGLLGLRELHFLGAVLAFPGVREARYADVPLCVYDGKLMTDPFLIPRVCIGARTYAYGAAAVSGTYDDIDPIDDFAKDVEKAVPRPYVSRGPETQPVRD